MSLLCFLSLLSFSSILRKRYLKLNSSSEGFSGSNRRRPLQSMVKSSVENGDDKALSIFTYSSLLNVTKSSSGYRLMYSLNANVSESDSATGQYTKVKCLLFLKSLREIVRQVECDVCILACLLRIPWHHAKHDDAVCMLHRASALACGCF